MEFRHVRDKEQKIMVVGAMAERDTTLCAHFGEHCRCDLGARREYPRDFVAAPTEGGYLAARLPLTYRGAGSGGRETASLFDSGEPCGQYLPGLPGSF